MNELFHTLEWKKNKYTYFIYIYIFFSPSSIMHKLSTSFKIVCEWVFWVFFFEIWINVLSLYFLSSVGNTLSGSFLGVVCGWLPGFYSSGLRPAERIWFEKKYFSRMKGALQHHDGVRAGRGLWVPRIERLCSWQSSMNTTRPGRHWPDPSEWRLEFRSGASGLPHECVLGTSMGAARWWPVKAAPWMTKL